MVYKKPVKKKKKKTNQPFNPEFIRVRTPKDKEIIGIVLQRLGSSRIKVAGMDGKTRVCRIPGRLKKSLWVREGNTVLIVPWEFEGDKKADVLYRYNPTQVDWLKKKGYLKQISEFDEF
jgi:translation initiation factor 1A|tara:strand:- start:127 stop:483 length:357 start_codon:yes stop_codon:yes gene_type:complete